MKHGRKMNDGFTIFELLLAISVIGVLFALVTFNLTHAQHTSNLSTTLDSLISDLRYQQLNAMTGNTQGRGIDSNYGIYFGSTSYVLFNGSSYNSNGPNNYTVQLGNLIQETTTFTNSDVIFTVGSGEISGFLSGKNTITLKDSSTNQQITLTLNALGVISGEN